MKQLEALVKVLSEIEQAKEAERARAVDTDGREWLWPDEVASKHLERADLEVRAAIIAIAEGDTKPMGEIE